MLRAVNPRRVVCLGEALVDFVCERPVAALGDADSFVPYAGGSLPNIAVCAARYGAPAEVLGGAGDDEWGLWLRDRLAEEGVGVDRFVLMPGAGTSHAFVSVDADREPSFAFYGDPERPAAYAGDDLDPALAGEPGVLVVGSDTLLGAAERSVTMRAAALGRERGWQVLCDPNVRPRRWADRDEMLRTILGLVTASTAVKLNQWEGRLLTGEDHPAAAATALREIGARAVVVTLGDRGAVLASGNGTVAVPAEDAEVVDTTGAGDCVAGVLAAALAAGADPDGLAPAVQVAMEAAAAVVGVWGATAGLPDAAEARPRLAEAVAVAKSAE
jgi:sugar/nucleoside kinase (ribokinase family)